MHRIVTDHPEYVRIVERRQQLERSRLAASAAANEWDAERERERRDHTAAVIAAIENGEAPPPQPPIRTDRPDAGEVVLRVGAEMAVLRDDETRFLAEHASELLAELRDAERTIAKQAAPAVARLRELTGEWAAIATTAHALAAAEAAAVGEPRPPAPGPVTPGAIADAVSAGASFVPPPAETYAPEPGEPAEVAAARQRKERALAAFVSRRRSTR